MNSLSYLRYVRAQKVGRAVRIIKTARLWTITLLL